MDVTQILRQVRRRGDWTLRSLAANAETSHSTLSAYESGRVVPSVETLDRVIRAAGFDVELRMTRRITWHRGIARGDELALVLEVAEQYPTRHSPNLGPEKFGV